jgi:hypothetical protein
MNHDWWTNYEINNDALDFIDRNKFCNRNTHAL